MERGTPDARAVDVADRAADGTAAPASPIIHPSLYAADHGALREAASACVAAGLPNLHIDVMDGRLVPALGLTIEAVASVTRAVRGVACHVHLMVEAPERFIGPIVDAGARSVIVPVEATRAPHALVDAIRNNGLDAGLSINPPTAVDALFHILDSLDSALVMMVDPGRRSRRVIAAMFEKLKALRQRAPGVAIIADGAMDACSGPAALRAGADHFVCGAALFAPDPQTTAPRLRHAAASVAASAA